MRRFEPCRRRNTIAQWVERLIHHQLGAGSSPASETGLQKPPLKTQPARAKAGLRAEAGKGSKAAVRRRSNPCRPKPASPPPVEESGRCANRRTRFARPPPRRQPARCGGSADFYQQEIGYERFEKDHRDRNATRHSVPRFAVRQNFGAGRLSFWHAFKPIQVLVFNVDKPLEQGVPAEILYLAQLHPDAFAPYLQRWETGQAEVGLVYQNDVLKTSKARASKALTGKAKIRSASRSSTSARTLPYRKPWPRCCSILTKRR